MSKTLKQTSEHTAPAELININYGEELVTVSGRELHKALEVQTPYDKWFPRMCEYGFDEGKDYSTFLSDRSDGKPGKRKTDHQVTIPMAKEICMLQRSDKGKMFRQYFLKIEEQWNKPEAIMARALIFANKQLKLEKEENVRLNAKITADAPKVEFAEHVASSPDGVRIREFAKVCCDNGIETGEKRLFRMLREDGYLDENNIPYQQYVTRGYFKVKETYAPQQRAVKFVTRVTGKGQQYLLKKLKERQCLVH